MSLHIHIFFVTSCMGPGFVMDFFENCSGCIWAIDTSLFVPQKRFFFGNSTRILRLDSFTGNVEVVNAAREFRTEASLSLSIPLEALGLFFHLNMFQDGMGANQSDIFKLTHRVKRYIKNGMSRQKIWMPFVV